MTFKTYTENTRLTAIYPKDKWLEYLALGISSETGEVAGKVKKAIRDSDGILTDEKKEELKKELGDVFWYLARLCDELNFDGEEIMTENIEKLLSRKERGVIQGSGDNR